MIRSTYIWVSGLRSVYAVCLWCPLSCSVIFFLLYAL